MTTVNVREHQLRLIRAAAEQQGLTDYKIEVVQGAAKGDNYIGEIFKVRVTSGQKVLNLFLKNAPANEQMRRMAPVSSAFERETLMYSTVLPLLRGLQIRKSVSKPFVGFCGYYGSNLEEYKESILLEDLNQKGYRLWERRKPMDELHAKITVREYAKLHAASMALGKLQPDMFKKLSHQMVRVFVPGMTEALWGSIFRNLFATIGDDEKLRGAVEKFQAEFPVLHKNATNAKIAVVQYDCWCNNILFKYKEKLPTEVCFVDWQLAMVATPVWDLAYFLCVNTSKEILQDHQKYLKLYHDQLSRNLKEMGCDPEEIFGWDLFMEHWRRYSKFGITMAALSLKFMITDEEDVPMFGNEPKEDQTLATMIKLNGTKGSEYERRLYGIVEYFVDNGLM